MNGLIKLLAGAAMALSAPASAQSAIGDWFGTLGAGPGALRVVVHITGSTEGPLSGTLDSPDQNARGIPLAEIEAVENRLAFTIPVISGKYRATWDEAGQRWQGTWEQTVGPTPLDLTAVPPPPPPPADWQFPADDEVARVIAERNAPRSGQGIVAGMLEPQGARFVAGGPVGRAPFEEGTLFEIGSISKVFTALILADMANKGEVSLDDPAAKYLPAGHHMPERNGRQITLADLSMHVSGLPRLPENLTMGDPDDPYVDYTEAQLLAFLDSYQLSRDIGSRSEYSNLGVGLLGYLLGRAAGSDYETLLRERITGPLGMSDTAVTLSPALAARLAPSFNAYMRPAKPWNLPALMGAGGIRSTATDMLKFASAVLDHASPIAQALETTLAHSVATANPQVKQALGWQVVGLEPGRQFLFHSGGTGGFRSALAIDPTGGRATVVLLNSAVEPSADDLAFHLLAGLPVAATPPVAPPPPPRVERTEVSLPPAELDRVLGRYEFGPGFVFNVTREGDGLRAQREGSVVGPVLPIFPEAPLRFFYRAVDAQVRFTTDESGVVTGAVFSQGGQDLPGKRLEG